MMTDTLGCTFRNGLNPVRTLRKTPIADRQTICYGDLNTQFDLGGF